MAVVVNPLMSSFNEENVTAVESKQHNTSTITAIATATGKGGVGIIRISGPQSKVIAEKISGKVIQQPRTAHYAKFYDDKNEIIDEGLILYFAAPNSFTGEEVVELQGHGSPVALDRLLKQVIKTGATLAKPGEFSERAFLNGKLDLTQAEAIADLINASSEQAARCAMRSLQGVFSKQIYKLVEELIQLRVFVEAAIDFPDEEIDFLQIEQITSQLKNITQRIESIFHDANRGRLLQEGMTIVIAGKPNAGKSSVLNQLVGEDIAIVTDVAGTTRDVIRQHIHLDGLPLHIVDTAGLRYTPDVVESEGVKRSLQQIEQADRVLLIVDSNNENFDAPLESLWPHDVGAMPAVEKISLVCNKIDLITMREKIISAQEKNNIPVLILSAKTGEGMPELREYLKQSVGYSAATNEGQFTARRRHLNALEMAQQNIKKAITFIAQQYQFEIIAEELRLAQNNLNSITGEFRADDLLGEIFSSFCIGK